GGVLVLALIGGISAAASMVIVDATALATMVSNDLIFPALLQRDRSDAAEGAFGRRMLRVRRASILGIVAASLAWALLIPAENTLASIGLVAFAAMAQFTPHLILATQGGGRDALAARVSLSTGFALWLYTLALPPILPDAWMAAVTGTLADPMRLFGIGNASPLVHGVAWSLGANLIAYSLVAARKVQARPLLWQLRGAQKISDLDDLVRLTASFVGTERAQREFPDAAPGVPITRAAAQRARDLIARVVGASSARALVASALAGSQMSLADVTRLLGERGQSLRFSRELLAATFENVDAGISVVDAEMNLVAWNSQYLDIFGYPPGLVRVGTPIADLIRYNARLGDFGSEDIEHHVAKRLMHMRRGQPHSFERQRKDGRVIKTVGGPMPGGGYVTSFTDITAEARMRDELERTLAELEQRVADRTQELSSANRQLAEATRDKTRFLAAASHDLLQPLHAARLFTAALTRDAEPGTQQLAQRIDSAIGAADGLIRALLDISRLDAGGVE
ncbi:PAS-domain containing protein, partial [Blastomonas sp. CCH2-A2]